MFRVILLNEFRSLWTHHKRPADFVARSAVRSATCVRSIDAPNVRRRGESGPPCPDIINLPVNTALADASPRRRTLGASIDLTQVAGRTADRATKSAGRLWCVQSERNL